MIDHSLLVPGENEFSDIKNTYMIMPFDLFGYKKFRYVFHLTCDSILELKLDDGVEQIRSNEEVGVRWMQEWEEKLKIKKEAREEGLEEGRQEGWQEGRKEERELGIKALVITSFKFGATGDDVLRQLMELYQLTDNEARERIRQYRRNI